VTAFDDIVRTTFAARNFTDRTVTDDEVAQLLDVARFAPSGGNRQGWRVVVLRQQAAKEAVFAAGLPALRRYVAERAAGHAPFNTVIPSPVGDEQVADVPDAAVAWFRDLAHAPVVLVIGVDLSLVASVDASLDRVGVISGASIYPFVQNVLLAARARGLAGVLTTFSAAGEAEVQRQVGFPAHVAIAAVVPLGEPTQAFTRLRRDPVEAFTRFDHWDGAAVRPQPERCPWAGTSPEYVAYHDTEWGRPVVDDAAIYEKLCLEGFQSGLAWITILRKRQHFRAAFAGFDPEKVAAFDDGDVERLLGDAGIVRHRGKIEAAITNARAVMSLWQSGRSLASLMWAFEPDRAQRPAPRDLQSLASSTAESVALSKELRRHGFVYVGPTTVYSAMQALGVVNDHLERCHVRVACEAERRAQQRNPGEGSSRSISVL